MASEHYPDRPTDFEDVSLSEHLKIHKSRPEEQLSSTSRLANLHERTRAEIEQLIRMAQEDLANPDADIGPYSFTPEELATLQNEFNNRPK